MYIDYDAAFSKLIVDTQFLAQKSVGFINKLKSENETLSKSRIDAIDLLKKFSSLYNNLKESFT